MQRWPVLGVRQALIAATAYFLALFSLGFVLGTVRVLVVVPEIGRLAATLLEVPVMLIAAWLICRAVVRHWHIPPATGLRLAMVVWFLALLALFETVLGVLLFGKSLSEQWSGPMTVAGVIGMSAQTIAALLLLFVGRMTVTSAGFEFTKSREDA